MTHLASLILLGCLALAAATVVSARATEPWKRPNILLIYADDQSTRTVGCYPEAWDWV